MEEDIKNKIDNRNPYYFRGFIEDYIDLLLLKVKYDNMSFKEYMQKVNLVCDFFQNDPKADDITKDDTILFYRCIAKEKYNDYLRSMINYVRSNVNDCDIF